MENYTSTLVDFVSDITIENFPDRVVEEAKKRILDYSGVELYGYNNMNPKVIDLFSRPDSGSSTIIGFGKRVPPEKAALVNSFISHSTTMEDGSRFAGVHPSSSIIPAALSIGEQENLMGSDVISAIVLGYETMLRVGEAIYPSVFERGFHPTGIVGPLGASIAAGKLMDLSKKNLRNALTISCTLGSGLMEAFKAPSSQPIQVGRGSEGGVISALLAKRGIEGAENILEEGFLPAHSNEYFEERILDDLGEDFRILTTYIKLHGGCRHVHTPIDVAFELKSNLDIESDKIEKINVKTYSAALDSEIENPGSGDEARFSIPFAVSAAFLFEDLLPSRFSDDNIKNEKIQDLMKKVKVEMDSDLEKKFPKYRGAEVEIEIDDGRRISERMYLPRGEPEKPCSYSEVEKKYRDLTSSLISTQRSEKIMEKVRKFQNVAVRDFISDLVLDEN